MNKEVSVEKGSHASIPRHREEILRSNGGLQRACEPRNVEMIQRGEVPVDYPGQHISPSLNDKSS